MTVDAAPPEGDAARSVGSARSSAAQVEALERVVALMDRLRSPGGCPWVGAQTHATLQQFVVDEAHELVEAVETGDRAGLREELGDVLQQVLFHARVAAEHPDDPFDLADVADGLAAKLVRRHPHVFAPDGSDLPDAGLDVAAVHDAYERLKREEKVTRASALDGVPPSLGALSRAEKLVARADRAGLLAAAPLPPAAPDGAAARDVPPLDDRGLGERLLALVAAAHRDGLDAEGALRRATAAWESSARSAEASA